MPRHAHGRLVSLVTHSDPLYQRNGLRSHPPFGLYLRPPIFTPHERYRRERLSLPEVRRWLWRTLPVLGVFIAGALIGAYLIAQWIGANIDRAIRGGLAQ
jgi:hypothetical protein